MPPTGIDKTITTRLKFRSESVLQLALRGCLTWSCWQCVTKSSEKAKPRLPAFKLNFLKVCSSEQIYKQRYTLDICTISTLLVDNICVKNIFYLHDAQWLDKRLVKCSKQDLILFSCMCYHEHYLTNRTPYLTTEAFIIGSMVLGSLSRMPANPHTLYTLFICCLWRTRGGPQHHGQAVVTRKFPILHAPITMKVT